MLEQSAVSPNLFQARHANDAGGEHCDEPRVRELAEAGIRLLSARAVAFRRQDGKMAVCLSDGTTEMFDVIYPVLGCEVFRTGKEARRSP